MRRDYDSTVARMAGNIAAGLVTVPDVNKAGLLGPEALAEWIQSVTVLSVGIARAIVNETRRTETETV